MTAARRPRLAERRRTCGFTQESLAAALGVDRSTVARWERGQCDPQLYHRSKLCELLQVSLEELDELLTIDATRMQVHASPAQRRVLQGRVIAPTVVTPDVGSDGLEDMNRRELLRLLSVAGTLVAVPDVVTDGHADDSEQISQYEQLNSHLWQVYALSESKWSVYPVVRQQLDLLTGSLDRAHSSAAHKRLCVAAGDLLQLAGEIFFDSDRYTEAAHCYKLAADASKEGDAFDLWACALTRHAYLGMYERRFEDVMPILEGAARVARRGDGQLSTRHWVAAVQAEAYAGLGDLDACQRALDEAEQVKALTGSVMPGGWLRFDDSRLAEERGTCYATLGRADLASEALIKALGAATSPRRRGSILTDLAALGMQTRDLDRVLDYGGQAVELAEQTRSSGYIGRKLRGLRTQLAPLASDSRAAQLSERIAQL
ncbi:helix-turn-helix domain-containing protein [Actinoallomurus sp. NPDC052274]|uniref:helix-turn-helix transcriptional regulator n=1 Tax=Actinoallomurus sp. NPDC052274 TaxID=3155420 RepID=UPI0034178139